MNRIQFWVLTYSIILIAPLFLTDIYLSRVLREDERKVIILQRVAQEGSVYSNRWQQLATRVYQASLQDPVFKDVIVHQHIVITPRTPAAAPSTPEPAPAPTTKQSGSNRAQTQ